MYTRGPADAVDGVDALCGSLHRSGVSIDDEASGDDHIAARQLSLINLGGDPTA
ncbi:MAG: hypothetical protein WKF73_16215 [Nocardioidaceae bacterium]